MIPHKTGGTTTKNARLRINLILALFAGIGTGLVAGAALAQDPMSREALDYPTKPIRLVAPSSVGGGIDWLTRMFGAKMTEHWGKQVVVDNRPGAGGIIGSDIVAKAPPDGYTLLMVAGGHALNPFVYAELPYDTLKDFERVSLVACAPNVLLVHPLIPVKSVRELIALAKAKPNHLNHGSAGVGTTSYLQALLLKHLAGVEMVHVPYKGAGAASAALVAGEVQLSFTNPNFAIAQLKAGRLRALGVTSAKRLPIIPDVPTIAEAGLSGYEVNNCYGILVPAKTLKPIVAKLNAEILRILRLPEIRAQLEKQGYEVLGGTPEEFTAFVKAEMAKWSKALREAGFKPEL